MSFQLFKEDILFYQRFLKVNGFYNDILDGIWGPNTTAADKEFVEQSNLIAEQLGRFDSRSERNIFTLMPKAQMEARKFLKLCPHDSKEVRIISGTRTFSEQDELFAQGRTKPGNIVTRAKGGQSNHNFGIAWDIGIFINGAYIKTDPEYRSLANIILSEMSTIEWGGHFINFRDFPHYQMKTTAHSVSAIRDLFENGESFLA